MRNWIPLLALLLVGCLFGPAFAAEATVEADAAVAAAAPAWVNIVSTVLMVIVLPFVIRLLRAKEEEAKKKTEGQIIDSNKSLVEQKGLILERLKAYLWGQAARFAERDIPMIAQRILNGGLRTKQEVKEELYDLGQRLRFDAIGYFGRQGIDLIATIGDKALDELIDRAANAVSPFPGLDSAKTLLQENVSNLLVQRGVEWMKENVQDLLPQVPEGAMGFKDHAAEVAVGAGPQSTG